MLPDGTSVIVKNFNTQTAIIGDTGVYDKTGKPIMQSKQGQLKGQAKSKPVKLPPGTEYVLIDDEVTWAKSATKVPKSDYVMIDDEVTWLPATLSLTELIGPESPGRGKEGLKGLSPQPDPPGRGLR